MGMAATKFWTIEELDQLPDDGNKYEVIEGELFVTPAPSLGHEQIAALLTRLLDNFVEANNLGIAFGGRPVLRVRQSSVEPDVMVSELVDDPSAQWAAAPKPMLVVEVHSPSTRSRDRREKREFYMRCGIPEYWMVDPEERTITQVRPGQEDIVARDSITWRPPGTSAELTFELVRLFGRRKRPPRDPDATG